MLAALAGYAAEYDAYDAAVLIGAAIGLVALAWQWRSLQSLTLAVAVISLGGITLYQGELARAEQLVESMLNLENLDSIDSIIP